MADQLTARQKRLVVVRARGCCEYCRTPAHYSPNPFAIEHITPRSQGGKTVLGNVAYSCQGCNNYKYVRTQAIDPLTGREVPLYHPRKQTWHEHFAWNEEATHIVRLTPTGRATVATLRLNREGLVNLRRVLHVVGEHPPREPRRGRRQT
jgi:hypothetical protein